MFCILMSKKGTRKKLIYLLPGYPSIRVITSNSRIVLQFEKEKALKIQVAEYGQNRNQRFTDFALLPRKCG